MTEKQIIKLNKILHALPDDNRDAFRDVAEFAMSLGYLPKLNAKETYADFIKSKHRKTIMKIDTIANPPRLAIRFDALHMCSGILKEAVESRLKKCGTYNHCVNCNGLESNFTKKYKLSDGRECLICNTVIDIPSFGVEHVSVVKDALKIQDDYLMSLIAT